MSRILMFKTGSHKIRPDRTGFCLVYLTTGKTVDEVKRKHKNNDYDDFASFYFNDSVNFKQNIAKIVALKERNLFRVGKRSF